MSKVVGLTIIGVALVGLLAVMHQSQAEPQENTFVKEKPQELAVQIATISGENNKPHVLFVNVGGAVPDAVLVAAQKAVQNKAQFNMRLGALERLNEADLVAHWGAFREAAGPRACVTVFVSGDPQGSAFLSRPGAWALINVRSLKNGEPSAEVYQARVGKMLMKGLAHAAGVGANHDDKCVMFYKSFSLDGIDATSMSYSPFAYFPLRETLTLLGGKDLAYEPDNE